MKCGLKLSFLLFAGTLFSQDDGLARIENSWKANTIRMDEIWFAHEKAIEDKFKSLEKRIAKTWNRLERSTQFTNVQYADDGKSLTKIAFDTGTITVEVIDEAAKEDFQKGAMQKKLYDNLREASSAPDGNNVVYLKNQIGIEELQKAEKNITRTAYKAGDGKQRVLYGMTVPLKKDHMTQRAAQYAPLVQAAASKYEIPADLVMAIIESESAFNPYADNGIAYGLMQIVPSSGGAAASKTVFGKEIVISTYKLKKPELSIELGSALLYQSLYWKAYFGKYAHVKDKQELMAIAGYNCGAPRVAKWINNNTSFLAGSTANFFSRLKNFVPQETKNYLDKVPVRRAKYKN